MMGIIVDSSAHVIGYFSRLAAVLIHFSPHFSPFCDHCIGSNSNGYRIEVYSTCEVAIPKTKVMDNAPRVDVKNLHVLLYKWLSEPC